MSKFIMVDALSRDTETRMAVNPDHIQLLTQDPHDSTRVVVIMMHDERFTVNGSDAERLGWQYRCKAEEGAYSTEVASNPLEEFEKKLLTQVIPQDVIQRVVEELDPGLPGLKAKLAKWRAEQ